MRWLWIIEDLITYHMTYVVSDETDTITEQGDASDEFIGKTIINLAKDHNVRVTSIGPARKELK